MATGAIPIARACQIVEPLRGIRRRSLTIPVTLQAKQADVASHQHAGINRAVRDMTGQAPIRPQGDVFKNERTLLICVTTKAKGISPTKRIHALRDIERRVLFVTVTAVHAPFGNFMVERASELSANLPMALEAETRRLLTKNIRMRHLLMRIVAIVAGDGVNLVLVLMETADSRSLLLMTGDAHLGDLSCRGFGRIEDMSLTAGLNMLSAWAMTHLTAFNRRKVLCAVNGSEMRRPRKPGVKLRMTCATGLCADKIGGLHRLLCLLLLSYRLASDKNIQSGRDRAQRLSRNRTSGKSIS